MRVILDSFCLPTDKKKLLLLLLKQEDQVVINSLPDVQEPTIHISLGHPRLCYHQGYITTCRGELVFAAFPPLISKCWTLTICLTIRRQIIQGFFRSLGRVLSPFWRGKAWILHQWHIQQCPNNIRCVNKSIRQSSMGGLCPHHVPHGSKT